jgi:Tfp pilus assembly protein PilZ
VTQTNRSLETPAVAAGRRLVVVGAFRDDTIRTVEEAMTTLAIPATFVTRCEDSGAALADTEPLAIVVRMDAPNAEQTYGYLRGQARFGHVPLLGVAAERNGLAFAELFSWGGDDLVELNSPQSLVRRLRPLSLLRPVPSGAWRVAQGCAIVASADARWRSVMGRSLGNGGFAVRFVSTADELMKESVTADVRLVVAVDELAPTGLAPLLRKVREDGSVTPWVAVVSPKRMALLLTELAGLGPVSIADGYAPPENVLFLANELFVRRGINLRASPRVLYGTAIAFRVAGRDEDEIGFSYNVSAGGVYVRTLAPLAAKEEVWLEMWPPRSEPRVRLIGTVAWQRPFGPHERATVPSGFGVRITGGLAGDFDRWNAGYDAFAESVLGARGERPSPPQEP